MNRMLADLLSTLNLLLALVIIVAGAALGFRWAVATGDNLTFGTGMGFVLGIIAAAAICGILAALILVERHLRLIADDIEEMRARDARAVSK